MPHASALPHTPSGRDLALALALEMRALCDLSHRLPLPDGLGHAAMVAAQDQDRLAQTLEELALFLERTADGFGAEASPLFRPALERIRLQALAARLAGADASPQEAGGDLELL